MIYFSLSSIDKPMEEIMNVFDTIQASPQAEKTLSGAVGLLMTAKRIFCTGAGRSGLLTRMFAMRLAQAGFAVHCVGDATTPSIEKDDVLCIVSGSGGTPSMKILVEKAKKIDARILLLTYSADSLLADMADVSMVLPIPMENGNIQSDQRLGTLFDQCAMITLDIVADALASAKGVTDEEMQARHANLE